MIIDRNKILEFPYDGVFYRVGVDDSLPPSQQVEQDVILLETKCNVQEAGSNIGDFINASYKVFFSYNQGIGGVFPFKQDDLFRCNVFGLNVSGKVIGIFPSQLGKAYVYIKDLDV